MVRKKNERNEIEGENSFTFYMNKSFQHGKALEILKENTLSSLPYTVLLFIPRPFLLFFFWKTLLRRLKIAILAYKRG